MMAKSRVRSLQAAWRLPLATVVGLALIVPLAARPAVAQPAARKPPRATSEEELQRAITILQTRVQKTGGLARDVAARLPQARQDLTQLIEGAEKVQVLKSAPQLTKSDTGDSTRQVRFRPPIERATDKDPIGITCQEGRIRYMNYSAADVEFKSRFKAFHERHPSGSAQESFQFNLPESDYHCEGTFEQTPAGQDMLRLTAKLTAVRNTDSRGESLEEAQQPGSRFQQILAAHPPDKYFVQFAVWPDSFETFRKARELAWDKDFEANWNPHESGKTEMSLGIGGLKIQ